MLLLLKKDCIPSMQPLLISIKGNIDSSNALKAKSPLESYFHGPILEFAKFKVSATAPFIEHNGCLLSRLLLTNRASIQQFFNSENIFNMIYYFNRELIKAFTQNFIKNKSFCLVFLKVIIFFPVLLRFFTNYRIISQKNCFISNWF